MSKTQKVFSVLTLLIIMAWWFRFDTNCSSDNCVAFDRFTGRFIITDRQARLDMQENIYPSNEFRQAAPAAPAEEQAPSAEDYDGSIAPAAN